MTANTLTLVLALGALLSTWGRLRPCRRLPAAPPMFDHEAVELGEILLTLLRFSTVAPMPASMRWNEPVVAGSRTGRGASCSPISSDSKVLVRA